MPSVVAQIAMDARPKLIENIGAALTALGMADVEPRSTARIPSASLRRPAPANLFRDISNGLWLAVCMFRDPHTGVECDISIHNALALRNTRLLRVYSMIDPRVRWLAYTLKRWVKARHLNDPSDSTLSSYGLLLLLFHFLQTRSPPILPNLQKMQPSWPSTPPPGPPQPLPSMPIVLPDGGQASTNDSFPSRPTANDCACGLTRLGVCSGARRTFGRRRTAGRWR